MPDASSDGRARRSRRTLQRGVPVANNWYVCKYVGTPGDFETLRTGQNPIFVDENAVMTRTADPRGDRAGLPRRSRPLQGRGRAVAPPGLGQGTNRTANDAATTVSDGPRRPRRPSGDRRPSRWHLTVRLRPRPPIHVARTTTTTVTDDHDHHRMSDGPPPRRRPPRTTVPTTTTTTPSLPHDTTTTVPTTTTTTTPTTTTTTVPTTTTHGARRRTTTARAGDDHHAPRCRRPPPR